MKTEQLSELIYQMLETERGGMQVYETALRCVVNDELQEEWEKYLDQTKSHERIVLELMDKLGLDPARETPGRRVVRLRAKPRSMDQGDREPRACGGATRLSRHPQRPRAAGSGTYIVAIGIGGISSHPFCAVPNGYRLRHRENAA